jgi:ligand-binding sensor domain-containing protein/two-component sensor histidine kinase
MSRCALRVSTWCVVCAAVLLAPQARALDPHKRLTQYSHSSWSQAHGLPQDTVRSLGQTSDGFLWVGTDEGLARFDGYDFVVFDKTHSDIPSNGIQSLAGTPDGSLWIATRAGMTRYKDGKFQKFPFADGQAVPNVLFVDKAGVLWIGSTVYITRYDGVHLQNFAVGRDVMAGVGRVFCAGPDGSVYTGGPGGLARWTGRGFETVHGPLERAGTIVSGAAVDRAGNYWQAGNNGVLRLSPDGKVRQFGLGDGLPSLAVRAMLVDRDGNLWAGTPNGIARFENGRFVSLNLEAVRCLFEDREGNLWEGANDGLIRMRDDKFTVYGVSEGLPSDSPSFVYQDHAGRIWLGFHDAGLMLFEGGASRHYTTQDGLPDNEVYTIREISNGDLLIGTRGGLARLSGGRISTVPMPVRSSLVSDIFEDSSGRVWVSGFMGLGLLRKGRVELSAGDGSLIGSPAVSVCESRDHSLWVATYGRGLYRISSKGVTHFTRADGLPTESLRMVYEDAEGTVWLASFGGGLISWRNGKFTTYSERDGLLSDNLGSIVDDGRYLWLGTTRGVCRVARSQLAEFAAGRRKMLEPANFGVADGLRSSQCVMGNPVGTGAARSADGRIWFATARGVAVYDPQQARQKNPAPLVNMLELLVNGSLRTPSPGIQLAPGSDRVGFRYTGILLSAPESLRYSYRLEGLETAWTWAGARRGTNYNSLPHGHYRFHVRAQAPGRPLSEMVFAFDLAPAFYQTTWFRILGVLAVAGGVLGLYWVRLRQIRSRFMLVLNERARLAREIHDTLAQGFVGISSQLDAVAMSMPEADTPARRYLELARRMARHSLTEARRAVMDLRASMLEGQDLATAIESGASMWVAGSGVAVKVESTGLAVSLPAETEQHLLRIAQEAVTNAVKHASPSRVEIRIERAPGWLRLCVADDGRGFEADDAFRSADGHFGLLGMRERAQRLGGVLRLKSKPGEGTEVGVEVTWK